jgi:hypothetical protein
MQPSPPQLAPIGAIGLVLLACPLYALMLAALLSMPKGDPASIGPEGGLNVSLTYLYALVSGVLLWIVLGILLWSGWKNGGMPRWAEIGAGILFGLSAIAAAVAANLSYNYPGGWLIVVPGSLPPLIALYAMWAHLPALHAVFRPDVTSGAMLGAIAVVIIAPPPLAYLDALQFPARLARQDEEGKALIAEREAEFATHEQEQQAKFHRLTPDSPLGDYLDSYPDRLVDHEQVVAGARLVKSRQSDAERLLKEVKLYGLRELWRLDLEATPALCEAFGAALLKEATAEPDFDSTVAELFEDLLPNLKWLVAEHCSLDDGLAAAEPRVRHVVAGNRPDTRWDGTLAAIVELRQRH